MYCDHPSCKKEVDINSVAVSKPTSAFSLDMEGDVTPTVVNSSTNVINVCKNCGESDYLYISASVAKKVKQERKIARQKANIARQKAKKAEEKVYKTGCLMGLIGSPIFGIIIGFVAVDSFVVGPFFSSDTPVANFIYGFLLIKI